MPIPFLAQILISTVLLIGAYLLAPKPKQPKLPSVDDLEEPTAEAGRPIPVVWGSVEMSGTNVIWYGDKKLKKRKIKSGGKK